MKKNAIQALGKEYPALKNSCRFQVNKDIADYLEFFIDDKEFLIASLIQNPYGINSNLAEIKKSFGLEISDILNKLNKYHRMESSIFKNYEKYKKTTILFLSNYFCILENEPEEKRARRMLSKERVRYALKLLDRLDITRIRIDLEDDFFSILEPSIYQNYQSLLQFTRRKYFSRQKEIVEDFKELLKENGIKGEIQMRFKTIYSIHNKIIKKNLLFSQILDTIGLRMIVEREDDCYRAMVLILKKSPIMTSKVKDYIAVPKENGYQSIHLTILYEGYPVEIQIRTYDMHLNAQYGRAAHAQYKTLK